VGFFDPDETIKARSGLYVVWILAGDRSVWTLSVNMGTERRAAMLKAVEAGGPRSRNRERRLLEALKVEAGSIREQVPATLRAGWDDKVSLRSTGVRQRRYEAATILARTYPVGQLPGDVQLASDLRTACDLLQEAVRAKQRLAVAQPGSVSTPSPVPPADRREYVFSPGADTMTTVHLRRRAIKRTPRHETGLARYGVWLKAHGFAPATNVHPRDFIIQGQPEWIGEYKVVYGTDFARATREAHSQLKEYRHFLYPMGSAVPLLAVFSSAVPDKRVAWLNAEGIAVVCNEGASWRGCPLARAAGLGA